MASGISVNGMLGSTTDTVQTYDIVAFEDFHNFLRALPDLSSYSTPCLVLQQMRFTRQRFFYAVLVFPSHGELFQHEVLFYMACPMFSSHSRRYSYCTEKAIISKISSRCWISSRQQR